MDEEEIFNSDLDEVRTEKEAKPTFIPFSQNKELYNNEKNAKNKQQNKPKYESNIKSELKINSRKSKSEANNSKLEFDSMKDELMSSNAKDLK